MKGRRCLSCSCFNPTGSVKGLKNEQTHSTESITQLHLLVEGKYADRPFSGCFDHFNRHRLEPLVDVFSKDLIRPVKIEHKGLQCFQFPKNVFRRRTTISTPPLPLTVINHRQLGSSLANAFFTSHILASTKLYRSVTGFSKEGPSQGIRFFSFPSPPFHSPPYPSFHSLPLSSLFLPSTDSPVSPLTVRGSVGMFYKLPSRVCGAALSATSSVIFSVKETCLIATIQGLYRL